MRVFGLIMAGGNGTRFWPLSRKENPKQLLNLSGKDYIINETAGRLLKVIDKKNIFVITNYKQAEKTVKITDSKINKENVIREPLAKNTSACICYSALKLFKEYGDGVMVVIPSDAYVKDEKEYANVLKTAIKYANSGEDLITIGIKPTFASTGYGYIEYKKSKEEIKEVKRFVEKPDEKRAKKYYKSGKYLWNGGIFVWKISAILKQFEEFAPKTYTALNSISEYFGTPLEYKKVSAVYSKLESISVDYAIMEKAKNIKVIPADFGWCDVGSFDAIGVMRKSDENGNISEGDNVLIDSKNVTVFSSSRTVAAVGMSDVVIVETKDAVLVLPKNKSQNVKKVVESLAKSGRNNLL